MALSDTAIARTAIDNLTTVAALGMIAYAASMLSHEALGHGVVCALGGGHTVTLAAWGQGCDAHPAGIEAAGPGTQIVFGLLAWLALRFTPARHATLRALFWLTMLFSLFIASGYAVMSALTGFGDMAIVIQPLEPQLIWRIALGIAGGALYYASTLLGAYELRRFAGDDTHRLSRLAVTAYLAASAMACIGGALNRTMPPHVAFELAAASSLGGGLGLIRLADIQQSFRRVIPGAIVPIRFNLAWTTTGIIVAAAFIMLLGRGIG
jgi:hypothetical protein